MPLNKTITRADGVVMTYWRESQLTINADDNTLWCRFRGYLDKPAFQGGKTPVEDRGFTKALPAGYLTMTTTDLALDIRDYIKTTTEFSGATNAT